MLQDQDNEAILIVASTQIHSFLKFLVELYDDFGIDGLHELVDPSLEELSVEIKGLQQAVDSFDTGNDLILENRRITLAQSLLAAASLILNVQSKNLDETEFNKSIIQKHT